MANLDSYIIDFGRLILLQTDYDFQKNLICVLRYHNVIGIYIVYIHLQDERNSSVLKA